MQNFAIFFIYRLLFARIKYLSLPLLSFILCKEWKLIMCIARYGTIRIKSGAHFLLLCCEINFYFAIQRLSFSLSLISIIRARYRISSSFSLPLGSLISHSVSVTFLTHSSFSLLPFCWCYRLLYYPPQRRSPAAPFVLTFIHRHFSSLHFNNATQFESTFRWAFSACEWVSLFLALFHIHRLRPGEVVKRKLRCFRDIITLRNVEYGAVIHLT